MIVNRTIYVNNVEPEPLSMRVPMNLDFKLDVQYRNRDGSPVPVDLDGQLLLTTRTDGRTTAYSLVSTDLVNGKARAVIPAQTDPNGCRLRLVGTLYGEPLLLAMGTLLPVDFAGTFDEPVDVIDQVPLQLDRALVNDTAFTVKLWDDASKTDPYDLTNTVVTASILYSRGGGLLTPFTVTPVAANAVQLSLTSNQIGALPDNCWWTLVISNAGGSTTLCEGPVTVTGTTLLPLGYSLLFSGGGDSSTGDTYASGSFVPPDDSLLVVVASSLVPYGHDAPSAISDSSGRTWTKQKEQIMTNSANPWQAGVEIWTAPVAAGTAAAMTVAIDFNHHQNDPGGYYEVRVLGFTGYDHTAPVAQVFGDGGTTGRTGAYTATWPTVPNPENTIVTATATNDANSAVTSNQTPGADFTLIDVVASPAGYFCSLAQYRHGSNSTTLSMNNFTLVGSYVWSIAGIEIRGQRQA